MKSERSIPIATKLSTSVTLILRISIARVYYQVFKDQTLIFFIATWSSSTILISSFKSREHIHIIFNYICVITSRRLSATLSTYYLFNRNIYHREYHSKMYIYIVCIPVNLNSCHFHYRTPSKPALIKLNRSWLTFIACSFAISRRLRSEYTHTRSYRS